MLRTVTSQAVHEKKSTPLPRGRFSIGQIKFPELTVEYLRVGR